MTTEDLFELFWKNQKNEFTITLEEYIRLSKLPCEICSSEPKTYDYGIVKIERNFLRAYSLSYIPRTVCSFCSLLVFSYTDLEILNKCKMILRYNGLIIV